MHQTTERHDVFLSYRRVDKKLALKIQGHLLKAGVSVWMDSTGIAGGSDWESEISNAIARSRFFLPVFTPNFGDGGYMLRELEMAIADSEMRPAKSTFIVPAIQGRNALPPLKQSIKCSLEKKHFIDFGFPFSRGIKNLLNILHSTADLPRFDESASRDYFAETQLDHDLSRQVGRTKWRVSMGPRNGSFQHWRLDVEKLEKEGLFGGWHEVKREGLDIQIFIDRDQDPIMYFLQDGAARYGSAHFGGSVDSMSTTYFCRLYFQTEMALSGMRFQDITFEDGFAHSVC